MAKNVEKIENQKKVKTNRQRVVKTHTVEFSSERSFFRSSPILLYYDGHIVTEQLALDLKRRMSYIEVSILMWSGKTTKSFFKYTHVCGPK